jgi:hypothetical protein
MDQAHLAEHTNAASFELIGPRSLLAYPATAGHPTLLALDLIATFALFGPDTLLTAISFGKS